MPLEFDLLDDRPLDRSGITCKLEGSKITVIPPIFEIDFCYCGFECDAYLRVFSGTNDREKDFFTLYFKNQDDTGSTVFKINDVVLIDLTHGTKIPNGFIVDWTKISEQIGFGEHCLFIEVDEFGAEFTLTRGNFNLMPFTLEDSQDTVRFKTRLNGQIESDFDYENENVPFEIRLPAEFKITGRVDDFEEFLDRNRSDNKIHTRWHYEYEVNIMLNNANLLRLLLDRYLSGNEIQIDYYSLFKPTNLQTYKYVSADIEDLTHTRYLNLSLKFEDFIKNNIKHPYLG